MGSREPVPPQPERPAHRGLTGLDPRAATGFASAAEYERGRPSYPAAAVERAVQEFGLTNDTTVLDLAAGTGKLTRVLVPLVGRVIAVEPSRPMRAALKKSLPQVEALEGTAEAIPLDDASVGAVFVGEAFHWFRPTEAAREIARVLVPGGGLALLWNRAHWSEAEHPWVTEFGALFGSHRAAAGSCPAGEGVWERALEETALFEPVSRAEVEHVQRLDPDGFVSMVASWSPIANLPRERRVGFLEQVRALVGDRSELDLRYRTELYWTRAR